MSTLRRCGLVLGTLMLSMSLGSVARAGEIVFTVGGEEAKGKAVAEAGGGSWSKGLTKALEAAAVPLNAAGSPTVVLRIAAGDYTGDLGSGTYAIPEFTNAQGTLVLEGGYAADFRKRDPFATPTRLRSVEGQSAPVLNFPKSTPSRQSRLRAFILDGVLMDMAASNAYDGASNSLKKGTSATHSMIYFGYFMLEELTVRNCIFLNSPHRVLEPLIRAGSDRSRIRLANCLFYNCVVPLRLDTARTKSVVERIEVDHCSFVLNWAYNPDQDSGMLAALEIGSKDAAQEIVISNSLFCANVGGAIQSINKTQPNLKLQGNAFFANGLLQGNKEPGALAMIVETNGRKVPVPLDSLEEVKGITVGGNVAIDPEIGVVAEEFIGVDSTKVVEFGDQVDIRNYAPKRSYDPAQPPFPKAEAAKKYGAAPVPVK